MNILQDLLPLLQGLTPIAVAIYLLNNVKLVLNLKFSRRKWNRLINRGRKGARGNRSSAISVREFSLGYKEISIKVEVTS